MQRYRYNVTIYMPDAPGSGASETQADLRWIDWRETESSSGEVLAKIARERPGAFALSGVPNALLSEDLAAWRAATGAREVADAAAVVPEDLREGAARVGYDVALSWARGAADGSFDAVLYRRGDHEQRLPRWNWLTGPAPARAANDPLEPLQRSELVARVRAALGEQLPTYMMPATVRVLDKLPRTANGKLDRDALAARATSEGPTVPGDGDAAACELDRLGHATRDHPASTTERTLAHAWSEVLGCEELARTANFFAAGGTSLLAIRVAVRLKGRGVAISAQDLFRHQTVAELAAVIDTHGSTDRDTAVRVGAQQACGPANAARRDERAPNGRSRRRTRSCEPAATRAGSTARTGAGALHDARGVLLTGATGFLGIHLLRGLLEDGIAQVACLVRAPDDGAAEARIAKQWAWYFPDVALERSRVRALAGDITHAGLGLRARAHRALVRDCGHVIHAAADVRHVGDETEIFRVNVDGTANVLELVHSGAGIRLHHISTIGVKGVTAYHEPERVLTERDLDIGQIPTENYSASKLEAERIVQRSLSRDTGGTVQRVGTIAAHSLTGRFQRDGWRNFFLRYVRATVELGAGCDWPGRCFTLAPVDSVARAVALLADVDGLGVQTFHVSTPHTITHGQLIEELRSNGYAICVLAPEEFVEYALERARDPRWESAVGSLLGFIDPPPGRQVRLDASWTLSKLAAAGFWFPQPTPQWLGRFVAECVEVGALPGRRSSPARTPRMRSLAPQE